MQEEIEGYEPPMVAEAGDFTDDTLSGVAGQFDGGKPPSAFFPTWW
ncbi:hypothetical protein SUDANB171_03552 [Streptomyces sp. enrichment culture]